MQWPCVKDVKEILKHRAQFQQIKNLREWKYGQHYQCILQLAAERGKWYELVAHTTTL